jgi:hypothetical protein
MSAVIAFDTISQTQITPRYNIYRVIHKALRGLMADTLLKLGRVDVTDECELNEAIAQTRALLDALSSHVFHENQFVHPALEQAREESSRRTANDHIDHEGHILVLREQIDRFETAEAAQRATHAQQLYLDISNFVAENFEHMVVEETLNQAVLTRAYTDEELLGIEHRIVASLSPQESFFSMRWMLTHINAQERAFMLGGMKRHAPSEVFAAVMGLARELLTQRDYYKLETALG